MSEATSLYGGRSTIEIGDSCVLVGELSPDEIQQLGRFVEGNLHPWDDSLEVWVPRPSLLLRLVLHGTPDLSSLDGFRRLGRLAPLVDPDLDDSRLWARTSLAELAKSRAGFGVLRTGGAVHWVLPLEGWGYFQMTPGELAAVEPGLFSVLGVDRAIDFLRAGPAGRAAAPGGEASTGPETREGRLEWYLPWSSLRATTPPEPIDPVRPSEGFAPLGARVAEDGRSELEDRGGLDLISDPGGRDLEDDGAHRDLRRDPGTQDLLRDFGARESFRLGVALGKWVPPEIDRAVASGRSVGLSAPGLRAGRPRSEPDSASSDPR